MQVKRPTEAQIRARAYEIFLERGGQHGHETDDWLQAEYELMQLPIDKLAKLDPPNVKGLQGRKKSVVHVVRAALSMIGAAR
jgi:hypothetical protein